MIEFLKYEMQNSTDPLVFSISTSVHAPHLLLRIQHFSYEELRYLIKRLLFSHYYPYSIQRDPIDKEVLYVTLAKNMYLNKYSFDRIEQEKWPRNL